MSRMATLVIFLAAGLLLLATPQLWAGQPPLPAKAQQALQRGMLAVERQSWETALRHLNQAIKHSPQHPTVLYYLGAAHGGMQHHLLASLFWRAHLEAEPGSMLAGSLQRDIAQQEGYAEDAARELIQKAVAIADRLPEQRQTMDDKRPNRRSAYHAIIRELAKARELDWTSRLARRYPRGVTYILGQVAAQFYDPAEEHEIFQVIRAAEKYTAIEAEAHVAGYVPLRFTKCPVGLKGYPKTIINAAKCRKELEQRRAKIKQRIMPKYRRFKHGCLLLDLSVYLAMAGQQQAAADMARRGIRLVAKAEMHREKGSKMADWRMGSMTPVLRRHDHTWGHVFHDSQGEYAWVKSGRTNVHLRGRAGWSQPRLTYSFIAMVKGGSIPLTKRHAMSLDDPLLANRQGFYQGLKKLPQHDLPQRMAQAGARLLLALKRLQQ